MMHNNVIREPKCPDADSMLSSGVNGIAETTRLGPAQLRRPRGARPHVRFVIHAGGSGSPGRRPIVFRQRGSAESKPVADPHLDTGA